MFGWLNRWLRNRPRLVERPGQFRFVVGERPVEPGIANAEFQILERKTNRFGVLGSERDAKSIPSWQTPQSLDRLLRVVPVVQTAAFHRGELTISTLEIFEDGAVIRYQFVGAPEDREASENLFKTADKSAIAREMERRAGWFRRYAQQDIVLSDDLGTEYRVQPRGASGGTLKWESGFTISPSIPPDACQLRLTVAKLDFPWDLPGQTDSDPATFLIDL